jgi:hypothetical protein
MGAAAVSAEARQGAARAKSAKMKSRLAINQPQMNIDERRRQFKTYWPRMGHKTLFSKALKPLFSCEWRV